MSLYRYDFTVRVISEEVASKTEEPNTSLMDTDVWYVICRNGANMQNYNGKGSLFIQQRHTQDRFVRAVSWNFDRFVNRIHSRSRGIDALKERFSFCRKSIALSYRAVYFYVRA